MNNTNANYIKSIQKQLTRIIHCLNKLKNPCVQILKW